MTFKMVALASMLYALSVHAYLASSDPSANH